jgi:hypothetical protein
MGAASPEKFYKELIINDICGEIWIQRLSKHELVTTATYALGNNSYFISPCFVNHYR